MMPTLINGYDAVHRSVQNGLDPSLALAQSLLCSFARTDVPDDAGRNSASPFPGTSLTASSIGKMEPSRLTAWSSRPIPMIRASPVAI